MAAFASTLHSDFALTVPIWCEWTRSISIQLKEISVKSETFLFAIENPWQNPPQTHSNEQHENVLPKLCQPKQVEMGQM